MGAGRIGGARRAVVFWTATGLIALDTILFTMIVPALPEFAERDGFSDAVAALIFAAFPLGQLITAVLAADLVERLGRRPLLVAAPFGLALATLAFAFAEGAPALAGARLLQGAAAGVVWTAGIAAISDVYPVTELGFRIGLAETAGGAVGLAGPLVGGAMVDAFGIRTTFLIAAALPLVAMLPALAVPETRGAVGAPARLLPAFALVSRLPRARVAILSLATLAAVLALAEPLLPLDLDRRLDLSPFGVGLVFSAGLLAYFACVPPAGRWSDRRGRRAPPLVGGIVVAVALPLTAVGPAWWVAVAFGMVGAGLAGIGASAGALMVEAVDEAGLTGRYGLSAALLTIVFSLGYLLGPLLGAAAAAVADYRVVTIVAAVCVVVSTIAVDRILPGERTTARALARGPRGKGSPP